jgi:hypothetical protein
MVKSIMANNQEVLMATLGLDKDGPVESSPKKVKPKVDKVILNNLSKLVTFPDSPIKCEAINVYDDRWRVNIWTSGDNNAKIEGSWFVVADALGAVISHN